MENIPNAEHTETISVSDIVDELFNELPVCQGQDSKQSSMANGMHGAVVDYLEGCIRKNDEYIGTISPPYTPQDTQKRIVGYLESGVVILCDVAYLRNRGLPDGVTVTVLSHAPLDSFVREMREDIKQACTNYAMKQAGSGE